MTHLTDENIDQLYSEIEKLRLELMHDNYLLAAYRSRVSQLMNSDRLTSNQKQTIRDILYLDKNNYVSIDVPF